MNARRKFVELDAGRIARNKHRQTPYRAYLAREAEVWADKVYRQDLALYGEARAEESYQRWFGKPWHTAERKGWNQPPHRWIRGMKYERAARRRTRQKILRGDEITFVGHRGSGRWDWI